MSEVRPKRWESPADSPQETILVVDDTPENLMLMTSLLKSHYRVKAANNGKRALDIAQTTPAPDLILLDIMMPDMDGYEVCRTLKSNPQTQDIPVIFLTARSTPEDEQKGLEYGAVDYIIKPISPPIVLSRVRTHLMLKASQDFLRDKNAYLEQEIQRRTAEIQAVQDVTVMALASLAETRDNETGNHIRRTQYYVRELAETLKFHPRFKPFLGGNNIELLFKSAPLHDIGKVGISDPILLKQGPYEPAEYEIMKAHPALGRDVLLNAEKSLGREVPFLTFAKEIAYCHHEKWDGSGYPQGLKGDQIPMAARLMALADVYDALVNKRIYKPAFSHEKAVGIIMEGKGTHFDPDVVEAFLSVQDEFQAIAIHFKDEP